MTASMSAEEWDARYRGKELVWGAAPNRWVEQETVDLPAGRALDLACGEGRNSVWLAHRGWHATGVDFSAEALLKAQALAASELGPDADIEWHCADATQFTAPAVFDLALVVYLQLPAHQRDAAFANAWRALAPDGTLLVVAHHSDNLTNGVGGPQDPAVLYSAEDVRSTVTALDPHAVIEKCEAVQRPVDGSERPAIDVLFRARKST